MEIKVVFDKAAVNKKIHIGWGFSALVDGGVLFDTGEKGEWLLDNMEQMAIDAGENIESVVISHDHWDHTGGLPALLKKKKKGTSVYVCPNFSEEFKRQIIRYGGKPVEVERFMQIKKNIYTTGEIPGDYKGKAMPEQALVLKTERGISVITGCAHPGILNMLGAVKQHFKTERLFLVMGGFHLLEEDARMIDFIAGEFKKMGIEKAAPTHCSGPKAEEIFAEEYGGKFIPVKAGKSLKV